MTEPSAASYDVIVIGAGINGAAIARELALAGFKVLLLDRGDLACGASSASTRLIHGGLRYLEHAELGLVRESLDERERLLANAPHLVKPLEIHIPIYSGARRGRWTIRLGLALYETIFSSRLLPRHRMLDAGALAARFPGLARAGLVGGAAYFDAQARFPERLIVEMVLDASAHGASVITHCEARPRVVSGVVEGVDWRCRGGGCGSASARVVINAAGPWVDCVLEGLGAPPRLTLSKGSHLVFERFAGAPERALYVEAASDGRPIFMIPWNGLLLVGTTDERFRGDPSTVAAAPEEIEYLLAELKRLFPAAADPRAALRYTQSGLRPLPHAPGGDVGAVTRRHLLYEEPTARGLETIVGGKLTTHRALAEDVLKRTAARLGRPGLASSTRRRPLPGAPSAEVRASLGERLTVRFGVRLATRLLDIYGVRAAEIEGLAAESAELGQRLGRNGALLVAELVFGLDHEWASTLSDLLLRRSMVGLDAEFGLDAAGEAAEWLRRLGIWDRDRAAAELEGYRAEARRAHAAAAP